VLWNRFEGGFVPDAVLIVFASDVFHRPSILRAQDYFS
jgi:hypothetical protein